MRPAGHHREGACKARPRTNLFLKGLNCCIWVDGQGQKEEKIGYQQVPVNRHSLGRNGPEPQAPGPGKVGHS